MLVVAMGALVAPASATGSGLTSTDTSGPALTVPIADIEAAYRCHGDFSSPLEPVLFVPGTSVSVDQSFSWNYANYFDAERRPYCTIQPPKRTQGDIQIAGEYIVHAIRRTYAQAGRPIAVLGHSQGGMSPRWALRFWPDTRPMVADQIGMAPSNHGTGGSRCTAGTPCIEALWQQEPGSAFLQALNAGGETFAGIDYTTVYSQFDETVPVQSARLTTGQGSISNVELQSICPRNRSTHLLVGTIDPVAHAVVMDALRHDGPADRSRIARGVCFRLFMPGITLDLETLNLLSLLTDTLMTQAPGNPAAAPFADVEPALRSYATATG